MKSSKTFLYQKVFADIKSKIASGEYGAGHLLPSEREIGELYQVDRTTVRKALQLLCEEHLVTKLPGKGTCVSHAPSAPQIPNFLLTNHPRLLLQPPTTPQPPNPSLLP